MIHEAREHQARSRDLETRLTGNDFDWKSASRDSILSMFPDRDTRIRASVDALLFYLAASCEWEDWRHLAQVHAEALVADLGVDPFRTPESIFMEVKPMDGSGEPRIERAP